MVYPANHVFGSTLARDCESVRTVLQAKWLGKVGPTWRPKCVIVLHPDRERYRAAAGRNSLMTYGCSRVTFDGDRIVGRRIDLCGEDADRARSALAHEMCHVVLADHFGRRSPPRWADEGMAVLADSVDKQGRHERDLQAAVATQTQIPLGKLAATDSLSSSDQAAVFYGQSASLVRFLSSRKEPRDLLTFVSRSQQVGYDRAANEVYGFADVRFLENAWLADLHQRTLGRQTTDKVNAMAAIAEQDERAAR